MTPAAVASTLRMLGCLLIRSERVCHVEYSAIPGWNVVIVKEPLRTDRCRSVTERPIRVEEQ